MNINRYKVWVLVVMVICVYLFVSAPVPLVVDQDIGAKIPIENVLAILNEENRVARELYTREIVLAGKKSGIKFDEHWDDKDVFAGPLPAQFLRQTAMILEKSKVPLGLYLGSDFPINKVNLFEGKQADYFKMIKKTLEPQFFYVEDIGRYTFMAADIAISKACVTCHNKHKDTPKTDWKLNSVMGATTWTYPEKQVSYEQFVKILREVRSGFKKSYVQYLTAVQTFPSAPMIGKRWPRNGYYLPDANIFSDELERRASRKTLATLIAFNIDETNDKKKNGDI